MKYTLNQIVAIQDKMETMGGGFASALAEAMRRADADNLLTIVNAFPDLMHEYWVHAETEYVEQQAKTAQRFCEELDEIRSGDVEVD